jgi:DNA-binding transcriptional regulator YiaG
MNAFTVHSIRTYYEMSQREFAEKLNVSESTIAAIERGRRRVTENMEKRIMFKFELSEHVVEAIQRANKLKKRLS